MFDITPVIEDESYCSTECPHFKMLSENKASCLKTYKQIIYFNGFRAHCIIQEIENDGL